MAYQVSNDTPNPGYIQWTGLSIHYEGTTHAIQDGYTNYTYVWWEPAVSTTQLQASDTTPTLGDDDLLVFLNKDGIATTVPKATVVDGSLIVPETVLADAIAANAVTAKQIKANAVGADAIAAHYMSVSKYIRSAGYDGTNGWAIDGDGNFHFGGDGTIQGDAVIDGTLTTRKMVVGSVDNLIQNPGIETGGLDPHDASQTGGGTWSVGTQNFRSGSYHVTFNANGMSSTGTANFVWNGPQGDNNAQIAVAEGDKLHYEAFLKASYGGTVKLRINYFDSSGAYVAADISTLTLTSAYQKFSLTGTVPTGAVSAAFLVQIEADGDTTVNSYVWVDDAYARRKIGGDLLVGGDVWVGGNIEAGSVSASTITGSEIQGTEFLTATSGHRIEINSASWNNEMALYTGHANESEPATITSDAATYVMSMKGPSDANNNNEARVNLYAQHTDAAWPGEVTLSPATTSHAVRVTQGDLVMWGVTGQILAHPNVSADVAYAFRGDPDTGMFRRGANQIGWAINGTEWMYLTSTVLEVQSSVVIDGICRATVDNTYKLGNGTYRWAEVWATDGTINTSDSSTKTNVQDSDLGLDFVRDIRAVRFKRKNGDRPHYGVLADQVKKVMDSRGMDFAGYVDPTVEGDEGPLGLRYHEFMGPLIKAVQELAERVEALESA